MDFEKRLKNHLTEQADGIEIESTDPHAITARSPRSRTSISTMAAVLVVIAAAAGFWMLSSGDNGAVTEIAAGDSGEVEAEGEAPTFEPVAHVPLEVLDITAENSPGHGRVMSDNGIYYVLSTAPGRVSLNDQNMTDEQYMEIFRQNSFYVYDRETGWTVSEIDDRFVSDFAVDDGVLYVVSTGSKSGAPAAFGSSTDRGQSFSWTEIEGLPEVSSLNLMMGEQTVVFASRWGYPNYEDAMEVAADAGIFITDFNLRDFNQSGISYIEVEEETRCAAIEAQYLPNIAEFREWADSEDSTNIEASDLQMEYDSMLSWMKEEFQANGCEWNEEWETAPASGEPVEFEFPEPVFKTWEELGFTPPESWKSWATAYVFDGERFNDVGKPFGDEFQVGQVSVINDQMTVSVWDNTAQEEPEGETLWRTSNGVDWEQEIRRWDVYEEEGVYYDEFYPEPRAGDYVFRIWWDESNYIEYEEAAMEAEAAGEDIEAAIEELDYQEPEPMLQRRVGTGEWETVTLATLAPEINVGSRVVQDVRGTPFGTFLIFGESYRQDGPPDPGITVVYSNNGIDWGSFELAGNSLETYGIAPDETGDLLLFSNTWAYDEGQRNTTQAILVRPAQ